MLDEIETSLKLLSQAQVVTGKLVAGLAKDLQTSGSGGRWRRHHDDNKDKNHYQSWSCSLHFEKYLTKQERI